MTSEVLDAISAGRLAILTEVFDAFSQSVELYYGVIFCVRPLLLSSASLPIHLSQSYDSRVQTC
jgi:hypothetical protein